MSRLLFAAAALAVPVAHAAAAPLRYEPFDYAVGDTIQGKTNPDGETWLRAGTADPPNEITASSGNLTIPAQMPAAIGNSAEIDGIGNGNGAAIRLGLGATQSTGTVYYSFALRIDDLTGSNNTIGGFFIGLNNSTGSQTGNPTAVGARLQSRIDPNDPNSYNLGIFRNIGAAAGATSWSGPLTVGQTLFVVASYEIVAGAQNDIARLWINPGNLGDPSAPAATLTDNTTATGTDISIASIILRQSPAPHLSLDELRVGTEWADVTPIPEPTALAIFGLGAAGLLARRGRQK